MEDIFDVIITFLTISTPPTHQLRLSWWWVPFVAKKYIICVKLKDKLWDETCWCLLKFSETPPETATVSGKYYKIVFQARPRANNVLKDYWYKFTCKWLTGIGWV